MEFEHSVEQADSRPQINETKLWLLTQTMKTIGNQREAEKAEEHCIELLGPGEFAVSPSTA